MAFEGVLKYYSSCFQEFCKERGTEYFCLLPTPVSTNINVIKFCRLSVARVALLEDTYCLSLCRKWD